MNIFNHKILLFFSLCMTAQQCLSLSEEEINKLTKNLPHGGYGIRAKLIDEQKKQQKKLEKLTTIEQQELIDKIKHKIKNNKKFKLSLITAGLAGAAKSINTNQQSETQTRFIPIEAALPAAATIISYVCGGAITLFLIHKLEGWVNGPALTKIAILEKRINEMQKELITDYTKQINDTKAYYKEQIGSIKQEMSSAHRRNQNQLNTILEKTEATEHNIHLARQEMKIVEKKVKTLQETNTQIHHLVTDKILHEMENIENQVFQLTFREECRDLNSDILDPIHDNIEHILTHQNDSGKPAPLRRQKTINLKIETPKTSPEQDNFTILTEDGEKFIQQFKKNEKSKDKRKNKVQGIISSLFDFSKDESKSL